MRTLVLLSLLAAPLAAPLAAQSWSEAPTRLDFVVASGGDVSLVSFGAIRLAAPATNEHLRFGLGLRASLIAGDLGLTPSRERPGATTVNDTLQMKVAPITFNVAGHVAWDFNDRASAGLNVDVFGFTMGGMRSGLYTENATVAPVPMNGRPTATNIFGFGGNDGGSLSAEFYGSWKLNDTYALRGGVLRQRVEYKSEEAVASSTNAFAWSGYAVFAGMRITRQ